MAECSCGRDHGAAPRTAIDPVCGKVIDPAKTEHHAGHAGQTYHFCRAGCRTRFLADPARYAKKPGTGAFACEAADHPPAQAASAVDPVCGMTVDPARTTHHAEHAGQAYHSS